MAYWHISSKSIASSLPESISSNSISHASTEIVSMLVRKEVGPMPSSRRDCRNSSRVILMSFITNSSITWNTFQMCEYRYMVASRNLKLYFEMFSDIRASSAPMLFRRCGLMLFLRVLFFAFRAISYTCSHTVVVVMNNAVLCISVS
jgi:hypothetical protein